MNRAEITFQDIVWSLKRYLVWIILTTLLFTVGAWIYTKMFVTPMYTTRISMVVFADNRSNDGVTSGQLTADARMAETYGNLLRSQPVTQAVSEKLGGTMTANQIGEMLTIHLVGQILYIDVTSSNPQTAFDVANAMSDAAPSAMHKIARAGEMTSVDRASLPMAPSSPDVASNVILGFLLGLLLSGAVVIVIALLDTTIWREEDLEHLLNVPVLGSVPSMTMTAGLYANKKGRR